MRNNSFVLIDIFRGRLEFPELKRKVVELNEKFNPNEIIIESGKLFLYTKQDTAMMGRKYKRRRKRNSTLIERMKLISADWAKANLKENRT